MTGSDSFTDNSGNPTDTNSKHRSESDATLRQTAKNLVLGRKLFPDFDIDAELADVLAESDILGRRVDIMGNKAALEVARLDRVIDTFSRNSGTPRDKIDGVPENPRDTSSIGSMDKEGRRRSSVSSHRRRTQGSISGKNYFDRGWRQFRRFVNTGSPDLKPRSKCLLQEEDSLSKKSNESDGVDSDRDRWLDKQVLMDGADARPSRTHSMTEQRERAPSAMSILDTVQSSPTFGTRTKLSRGGTVEERPRAPLRGNGMAMYPITEQIVESPIAIDMGESIVSDLSSQPVPFGQISNGFKYRMMRAMTTPARRASGRQRSKGRGRGRDREDSDEGQRASCVPFRLYSPN